MTHSLSTRRKFNKCAEIHNTGYRAFKNISDLNFADNIFDYLDCAVNSVDIRRCDENISILVNINFNARFFNNFVDNLPACTNNFADFINVNFHCADTRSIRRKIRCRFAYHFKHFSENERTSAFCLCESVTQNFASDSRNFNIHLNGRHAFGRSRDFEIHIAECIFHSLNIRQNRMMFAVFHKSHGNAADGSLNRNAGLHKT